MTPKIALTSLLVVIGLLVTVAAFKTKEYTITENEKQTVKTMTTKTRVFIVAGVTFWIFFILRFVW